MTNSIATGIRAPLANPLVGLSKLAEVVENELPTRPLQYVILDGGRLEKIDGSRVEWLNERYARKEAPTLCNGDADAPVTISITAVPPYLAAGAVASAIAVVYSPETQRFIPYTESLLIGGATALSAYSASACPREAGVVIGSQYQKFRLPEHISFGLPQLNAPRLLPHPAFAANVGWLNYWSSETASKLSIESRRSLMPTEVLARRLDDGGWLIRLTEDPLDLSRSSHLAALKRFYEVFPEIGGRSAANTV